MAPEIADLERFMVGSAEIQRLQAPVVREVVYPRYLMTAAMITLLAGDLPKRKLIFQPQYFRCYVSFREGIHLFYVVIAGIQTSIDSIIPRLPKML